MATVTLNPLLDDIVPSQSFTAGTDTLVIPISSQTNTDRVFGFDQNLDRLDITGLPGVTAQQLLNNANYSIPGRVRLYDPSFNYIDLIGVTTLTAASLITATAPDLSITKTDTPDPVTVSQPLTYNLVVSNVAGAPSVSGFTITDTLPPGFTVTSVTAPGFTTVQNAGQLTFTGGTLAGGTSLTLTIAGTAPASATTLTNIASVLPVAGETAIGNNNATITTSVAAVVVAPDLAITKTGPTTPVSPSASFSYTLAISNAAAGSNASTFTITDTLPSGFNVTSVTAPAGFTTAPIAGGVLTITGTNLAGGANANILITGTAPATTAILNNQASIVPAPGEVNTTNNLSTVATNVFNPNVIIVDDAWAPLAAGTPVPVPVDPNLGAPQPISGIIGLNAFAQIQPGINAAAPGGTVFVAPGTYNEAINFVKSLTLSGPNATVDPLTGTRVTEAIIGNGTAQGSIGFERSVPGNNGPILIAGFSFGSLRLPGSTLGGYGIDTQNSNGSVTIRNNIFNNNRVGVGNQIASPGFPETGNVTIEQNLFNMSATNAAANEPVGIALQRVNGATIRNNRFGGSTRNGILIDPPLTAGQGGGNLPAPLSSGISITGNTFVIAPPPSGFTVASGGLNFDVSQSSNPGVFPGTVENLAPGIVTAIA